MEINNTEKERRRKISLSLIGNKRAVGVEYSKKEKRARSLRAKKVWQNKDYRKKRKTIDKELGLKKRNENHPNWKGGVSQIYYQRIARENLIQKCQICGNNQVKLQVHHKDFNRKNNNLENLMIVCKGCHNKIHKIKPPIKKKK